MCAFQSAIPTDSNDFDHATIYCQSTVMSHSSRDSCRSQFLIHITVTVTSGERAPKHRPNLKPLIDCVYPNATMCRIYPPCSRVKFKYVVQGNSLFELYSSSANSPSASISSSTTKPSLRPSSSSALPPPTPPTAAEGLGRLERAADAFSLATASHASIQSAYTSTAAERAVEYH